MARRYGVFPELPSHEGFVSFGLDRDVSEQWILIGELAEYGRRRLVKFDVSREKVVTIVGRRGQGKSYTLGAILEGMCASIDSAVSSIQRDRAVILFDPLNIFQWMYVPLRHMTDASDEYNNQADLMQKWGLQAVPLNVQVWVPAGHRSELYPSHYNDLYLSVSDFTLDDWSALMDIDMFRDIRGQYFSDLFRRVTRLGWEDSDGNAHAAEPNYSIQDLTECATNDIVCGSGFYREETIRAVLQRLSSYGTHQVFSSTGTALTDILKPGVLSVMLLNRLPEDLRTVLVAVLVRRIVAERAEASENAKDLLLNPSMTLEDRRAKELAVSSAIPRTWVVIDEIQSIMPADVKTAATDTLVKAVKEGRNLGISFLSTTQQPRAVHQTVMSQTETFLVHRLVSQADIEAVTGNLKSPSPEEIKDESRVLKLQDLIRESSVGYAVVSDADSPRTFVMEVRPRISAHGGFEA